MCTVGKRQRDTLTTVPILVLETGVEPARARPSNHSPKGIQDLRVYRFHHSRMFLTRLFRRVFIAELSVTEAEQLKEALERLIELLNSRTQKLR